MWYLVERGRVRSACYAPRDDATRSAARLAFEEAYDRPAGPVRRGDVDSVLLVAGWFRKRPDEAGKRMKVGEARRATH